MWDLWRNWADSHATSFFQSAQWGETLVRHYPFFRPEPVTGETFFLPMIRHCRYGGISDSLYSMPMMGTGGILCASEHRESAVREVTGILRRKRIGTLVISFPPGTPPSGLPEGLEREEQTTHLVDLSGGWERIYSRFKKSCKEAIRRAGRLGVTVRREENEEGVRTHWSLIEPQFRKWRPNPPLSIDFVRDLVLLEQSRLYVARVGDRAVLSLLAFVQGGEAFLWQSAKVSEGFPPGSSNLLTSILFREAAEEGCRVANFGGSLGNPRIESYKEAYGAVKTPFFVLKKVHPLIRLARSLRPAPRS